MPVTVSVSAPDPAIALVGLMEEMAGVGVEPDPDPPEPEAEPPPHPFIKTVKTSTGTKARRRTEKNCNLQNETTFNTRSSFLSRTNLIVRVDNSSQL